MMTDVYKYVSMYRERESLDDEAGNAGEDAQGYGLISVA